MILILDIFNSLCENIPDYASGMNPMPEFNDKVNESQKEIMDIIASQYDRNERIRTLLSPFVVLVSGTSSGTIVKPTGFYRTLGITVTSNSKTIPLYYSKENELINLDYIPQRKADFSRGIGYYRESGASIKVIPSTSVPYEMYYIREPLDASLDFTYADIGAGEMGLTTTGIVNLEWNEDAYNLIISCLLRKYGIISREQFLSEVGNIGLQQDLINQQ